MDFTASLRKPLASPFTVRPGPSEIRCEASESQPHVLCPVDPQGSRESRKWWQRWLWRLLSHPQGLPAPSSHTAPALPQYQHGAEDKGCVALFFPTPPPLPWVAWMRSSRAQNSTSGLGHGGEIQEEAAVPSQGHGSQAVAMQSSFSRELRPILPLIFCLDVKLDSSSAFYFVLPLSATPNPLLKYFGTMATQVRRLNPEVSLVTFLPVHLLKQNILLLPLVVISLHIHRHLKEQIHTKIAREPKRRPA